MKPNHPLVPELAPSELSPRVLLASFMLEPPRTRFTRFPVPGLNIYLVVGGRMRYRSSDGTGGSAGPGALVTFPYGYHEYEAMPGAPLAIYQTHFFAAPPPRQHGIPSMPPVGRLPLLIRARERQADFEAVFQRLMHAVQEAAPAWELEGAACVMELLHMAFRIAAGATPPVQKTLSQWDVLLAQMDRQKDVMVRSMAADMGYSTEHFIRAFKRRYGLSPKQYVLARRLDRARELLKAGQTVKAAAAACGFPTPLQLNRTHRRFYGHPPTFTRRSARGEANAAPEMRPGLTVCRHLWAPGVDMATLDAAMIGDFAQAMTASSSVPSPMPPHLTMDEYAEFVDASLRNRDPALVARQKELEERILTPFSMTETRQPVRRGKGPRHSKQATVPVGNPRS